MSRTRFSDRVFTLVLHLFPGWFRELYAEDMTRDFAEHSRVIGRTAGSRARVGFQIRAVLAVPGQALRVRRNRYGKGAVVNQYKVNTSHVGRRGMGRGWEMGSWIRDLRIAGRSLARRPGFALGVVLTLSLGIGATTTVYSVVDGVLLRPLPYEHPSALVAVGEVLPASEWLDQEAGLQALRLISTQNYQGLRDRARSFEALAAINTQRLLQLPVGDGRVEAARAPEVSGELFAMLAASPVLGRSFLPDEYGAAESYEVVMITYEGWQRLYGGDPDVVGHPLGGTGPTLVGVLPEEFAPLEAFFPGGYEADFYFPGFSDEAGPEDGRRRVYVLGRLRDGSSVQQARSEVGRIATELAAEFPEANTLPDGSYIGIGLNGLHAHTMGTSGRALGLFLGAAGLLLLLAVMNSATLLLARSLDRTRELGVRMALGASRTRVVRLLMSEAGILGTVGGALGVLLAYGGIGAFLAYAPSSIPRLSEVSVDSRVMALAVLLSLGSGLAAGLLPALRMTRRGPWQRLQITRGSVIESGSRLRAVLVGGQMTVAVVLLSGAGLLFNSFVRMTSLEPGFEADGLITGGVRLKGSVFEYGSMPTSQGWDLLLDELAAIPGVESVAGTTSLPFGPPFWAPRLLLPGDPPDTWREGIAGISITPGYLETMGTELLQGRGFELLDGPDAEPVALVNESFVRTQLGGAAPIDIMVRRSEGDEEVSMRIVGVVEDVVQRSAEEGFRPAIYVPYTQYEPMAGVAFAVRTTLATDIVLPDVRRVAVDFNSYYPINNLVAMRDRMARTRTSPRFQTALIGAFALVALLLAATGLYGSLAHSVSRRQCELGLRMALGADRRGVLWMVLSQGMRLSMAGLGLGMVAALIFTRALEGFLYEVEPYDPATLIVVGTVMVLVSAAACLAPALRATAVDPVKVLKAE